MVAADIESLIKAGIPDAEVNITDLGDGDHCVAYRWWKVSGAALALPGNVQSGAHGRMAANHACNRPRLSPANLVSSNGVRLLTLHTPALSLVAPNDVLLFMKGTPLFPTVAFFPARPRHPDHLGVNYGIDVLQDKEVRQGQGNSFRLHHPAVY
jgi:hypothetical protein